MKRREEDLRSVIRESLVLFLYGAFHELNPDTELRANWHIEFIAEALTDCFYGRTKRLIINIPPRSLKSHAASICFVAWILGHRPGAEIICASYSQDLSDKLARDCRQLMQSEFYCNLFPTRLSSSRPAAGDFSTTHGGTRLSTSVGGSMTGRGADFILIDDPLKPDEALSEPRRTSVNTWMENTVASRLNDKETGCIIVIQQRMHQDDLSGHLLEKGGWRHVCFPAIAVEDEEYTVAHPVFCDKVIRRKAGEALHPEREPLEVLAGIKASMSSYDFAGQYQQMPAPHGGGMVKEAWFQTYTETPEFDFVFQSWDSANTASELSDYSACTTWGVKKEKLFLLHVLRKRLEYPDLKRTVQQHARFWKVCNVIVEDKASGTQLIQELRRAGVHGVSPYKSQDDKVVRMNTVTDVIENGFVYLPEQASWREEFLSELSFFPAGRHDDQVDSMSQALDWYRGKRRDGLSAMTEWIEGQLAQSAPDGEGWRGGQDPKRY